MSVQSKATELIEYKGAGPKWGSCVSELDDERLLAIGAGMMGSISGDSGRTWGRPFQCLQEGKPMGEIGICAATRLADGRLGMVYNELKIADSVTNYRTRTWYFATSEDEAKSWSSGSRIDIPAANDYQKGFTIQSLWGGLLQLSSGRLVAPAQWGIAIRDPEIPPRGAPAVTATIRGKLHKNVADGHLFEGAMGGCYNYYSDDLGATWSICTGSMMVWPLPSEGNVGGFGACWEPTIIELKDGRVLMFMRTNVGRLYQGISSDGGATWPLAQPTELASGDVPCHLGRLRTTGDLIVAWNQSSKEEIEGGYSRGRVCIAVSRDEGASWGKFRTLDLSEGMEDVERVEMPPIAHVRSRKDLGTLPDDYARSQYPRLFFARGNVVVIYSHVVLATDPDFTDTTLLVVPEERLYD